MRQNHEKVLEQLLKKEGREAKITIELKFLDLSESSNYKQDLIFICVKYYFVFVFF